MRPEEAKAILTNLITDIYACYSPSDLELVPVLTDRFENSAYSFIDSAFIKFNRKSASFYNKEYDDPQFKLNLMKEYEAGNRPFHGKRFVNSNVDEGKKTAELITKQVEDAKKEFSWLLESFKDDFDKKKNEIKDEIEKFIKDNSVAKSITMPTTTIIKAGIYDDVEIKVTANYEGEAKLPSKEVLASLSVGSRIVTTGGDGKILGLKIEDVVLDCVSGEKPIIEITIERG